MATLARSLGIRECLEQPGELPVLGDYRVEEVGRRLAASEAGAAIALFVEVGEERSGLVEERPNPELVNVDDDVAQVDQRLSSDHSPPRGHSVNRPARAPSTARGTMPAEDRTAQGEHHGRVPFAASAHCPPGRFLEGNFGITSGSHAG
jgi:hypothetical protein